MSVSAANITELLARHAKSYNTDRAGVGFVVCRCGLEMRLDGSSGADDARTLAAHQAQILTADISPSETMGTVVWALEDAATAADLCSPDEADFYKLDKAEVGNWLRARAAETREAA